MNSVIKTMRPAALIPGRAAMLLAGLLAVLLLLPAPLARAADTDPHSIPAVDGGIGPCSASFTVKDTSGSPVYDAKVRVHIPYGHFHKIDLEVGTNTDGKARFTGLPNRAKSPWQFWASQGDREGSATVDPATNCRIDQAIVIAKAPAGSSQP